MSSLSGCFTPVRAGPSKRVAPSVHHFQLGAEMPCGDRHVELLEGHTILDRVAAWKPDEPLGGEFFQDPLLHRVQPLATCLFRAPLEHVEQPRGPGAVADRDEVDDQGHVLLHAPRGTPHVLVDADQGDVVEASVVAISRRLPSARTASFAMSHATANTSAIRATVRCWTTSPTRAQRTAARESFALRSAALEVSWRHTRRHRAHRAAHPDQQRRGPPPERLVR